MKIAKRVILYLLILFFIFILSGAFIAHFYGKEVTRYVLSEISKNVNVEIHVAQVENLSFFKKFPFASITLYDVMIKEPIKNKEEKDTLLFFEKIYLQFNVIDIFQSDYKIKRISIVDGFIRLKVDKNGKENYMASASGTKDETFLLKLSRMNISNFDIYYSNQLKEQEYGIHCNDAVLKGNFSNEEFLMNITGDFFTHQLKTEDIEFLSHRNISLKTDLEVKKNRGIYSMKKGEITIEKILGFEMSGNIIEKENSVATDIKITGKNLDITSAIDLLPQNSRDLFSDYETKGNITFNCKISGELSNEQSPDITAEFNVDNCSIKQKNTSYSLNSIRLKGAYSNGKKKNPSSSVIDIKECFAALNIAGNEEPGGEIEAEFIIKNLNSPKIKLSANASVDLNKLSKFIAIDTVETINGMADLKISYQGPLKSKEEFSAMDFRNSTSSGSINFNNVNFTLKQSPLSYRDFSGNLILHNNDVLIKEMNGKVSSSDFELNGLFRNALAWLFLPEEKLTIEAAFYSNNLNLNELLSQEENKRDTSYLLSFPGRVNFNLNADVASLSFRKFNATDLNGVLTITGKNLHSGDISFKTMDGKVNGTLDVDASSGEAIMISSQASFENIDISRIFYDFENFGQNVITDKHLKGIATADIHFAMMMDSSLHIDEKKIHSIIDLTINKGELINFEPMNDISGFIKNHVFLKRIIKADEFEKKLRHISFSNLKNQIQISDRKIIIPAMFINSSAMNIEAEGIHTFDNALDYKINFFLTELLTKKEDLSQEEFGEVEDEGTGKKKVFLTIKGTLDNPVITYDKKKMKKKLIEETQKEKKIVKGILKEEFGWFKKDTAAIVPQKEQIEEFMIEWEENQSIVDSLQPTKKQTKTKEKNLKKLLDKIGLEEKKKEEDFELEKGEDF